MAGFQRNLNYDLPHGKEGDFASANPRASTIAGEGALVAGPSGVTIGRFAWKQGNRNMAANVAYGAVSPDGFVHGEQQALITQYLGEYSNVIAPGFMVTLLNEGDFFVKVYGQAAVPRAQVYANFADGTAWFGGAPAGASATGIVGATFTATGSNNGSQNILTVSAVTGLISVGDTVAGAGIPAGTTILSQSSGTTGGAGVYVVSGPTTINNATATSYGNVLNVTAVSNGTITPGVGVSGTGIPAGASIVSQQSGPTGGTGLYTISTPATAYAASTALTTVGGVLTNFVCASPANVGEICKISTWGKM